MAGASESKRFWIGVLIQVTVLLLALAVAWGYQKAEIASVQSDVVRIEKRADANVETFRELTGKIEALTAEVKILNQLMTEERDRHGRVHDKQ
jgi:hypothetical protein